MPCKVGGVLRLPFAIEMRRKLVGAGSNNQTDQPPKIVMVLSKIIRQRFEQLGMAGLDGPGRWWRIGRVEPRKIEIHRWVHDADADKLGPDQVHGGARELRVSGQYARVSFAPCLAVFRLLAVQQELRRHICFISRHAAYAARRDVVVPRPIEHLVFVADAEGPAHGKLAEKCALSPQLGPADLAQPEIDFLQMALAVMAGHAFEIDAQKILTGADGHLVIRIRLIDEDVIEVVYMIAKQEIGGTVHKVVAGTGD